jgi:drug/metabolite transporter (DMT)-like permease
VQSARARSLLFVLIAAALWSTSGVILKSMPSVHWLAIAGVRSLFAALIFVPGVRARGRPKTTTLIMCVLIYAVLVSALMGSMQLGTAAQGIWLQYIAPAVVGLYAWFVQRQRIRPVETAALVLTVVAVLLIALGGSGRAHQQSVALGLISGFAFGAFILLLKSVGDAPPATIFFWTNLGTAAIVIPIALAAGAPLPSAPREWVMLAAMGWFQLGLAYYFFQWGLARARAVEASLIALLEPVLNPVWVYLFLGELPSTRVIIGCALMAAALVATALTPNQAK